jgi:RNA-binding protein NOB1
MKLLALVYTLEKEARGSVEHLRTEPRTATVVDTTKSTFSPAAPEAVLSAAKPAKKAASPSPAVPAQPKQPKQPKQPATSSSEPKNDNVVKSSPAPVQEKPVQVAEETVATAADPAAAPTDAAPKKKRKRGPRKKKSKAPAAANADSEKTNGDAEKPKDEEDSDAEADEASPVSIESAPVVSASEHAVQPESTSETQSEASSGASNPLQAASDQMGMGDWDDDDEESGWVTPENVITYTRAYSGQTEADAKTERAWVVTCITADFAMQNVLLQLGLHLTSVDGFAIKALQRWILRCYGCRLVIKDMSKLFCPRCGNSTLHRVQYTVDDDGNMVLQNVKTKISTRGTKYSVPLPKGGRKNNNLILSESQIPAYRPKSKANSLADADATFLDPHGRTAPKDVVVGYGRKNPNEPRKRFGKSNKAKRRGF